MPEISALRTSGRRDHETADGMLIAIRKMGLCLVLRHSLTFVSTTGRIYKAQSFPLTHLSSFPISLADSSPL